MTTSLSTAPSSSWFRQFVVPEIAPLAVLPVPRRYQEAEYSELQTKSLATVVRSYGREFWSAAEQGVAPLFAGTAGVGKTYAAAVLAKAIHGMRIPVAWCDCAQELVWIDREAFSPAVAARVQVLKTTPFVVMDDFTQFQDGRQLNTLIEIGSARYNAKLPTLWTGNVAIARNDYTELEKAVGVMLARRIAEMSVGFRVMVKNDR